MTSRRRLHWCCLAVERVRNPLRDNHLRCSLVVRRILCDELLSSLPHFLNTVRYSMCRRRFAPVPKQGKAGGGEERKSI